MPEETTEIKKAGSIKKSIRIVCLMLILAVTAELCKILFYSGEPSLFIQSKTPGYISFNKAALGEFYANYKNHPYSYCQGFRSKKNKGTYRVFLLGEASLSGWPYSTEQSVGGKIERNIQKYAPGLKIEIITISFAGFNSYHAADIIPNLFKYNPDMIILYSGHNEFYGYRGKSTGEYFSQLITVSAVQSVLGDMQNSVRTDYDNKTDDFELMLPLFAQEKFISNKKQSYSSAVKNYRSNLLSAAYACKEYNVKLVISDIADNYQLPPLGITNTQDQLSADIIFNNARMALLRDGNQFAAEKLFAKSLQLDGFRLRIPIEFTEIIKALSGIKNITSAQIKKEFYRFSQNNIPGDDLFLDYIHPNKTGLEIIAAEYSRIIMKEAGAEKDFAGIEQIISADTLQNGYSINDLALKNLRIEKSAFMLKKQNCREK